MERKLQKICFTFYSLLIALDLWKALYQILLIIYLKDFHRIKCTSKHDDKKCEAYGNKYKYCDCFLEYTKFKHDLIECKCLNFNKIYQQKLGEKLKEGSFNNIQIF